MNSPRARPPTIRRMTLHRGGPRHRRDAGNASRRAGFTLLELGICVAVLLFLAGLAAPGWSRARALTHRAACQSHLRQWGLATTMFAMDHADLLPKDGALGGQSTHEGWYVDLPRTLGLEPYGAQPWRTNAASPLPRSLWICPANPRRSNGRNLFHYCLNEEVNGGGENRQIRLSSVIHPALTPWLFDNGKLAPVGTRAWVHTNLHVGGANILTLDGRAAWYPSRRHGNPGRVATSPPGTGLVWAPGADPP